MRHKLATSQFVKTVKKAGGQCIPLVNGIMNYWKSPPPPPPPSPPKKKKNCAAIYRFGEHMKPYARLCFKKRFGH